MRIGIITFHYARNYGAFLQARSLLNFIASLGHRTELIDYRNPRLERMHRRGIYQGRRLWLIPARSRRWNRFEQALALLPRSPVYRHREEIDWSRYDAVVYGSDEIWNFMSHAHGLDPVYFGEGPPSRVKRVAYAPSLGELSADVAPCEIIALHLNRFDAISARDDNTARFIERCTRHAPQRVVDPVLIEEPEPLHPKPQGDVLVYGALNAPARISHIRDWATSNGRSCMSYFYRNGWCNGNEIAAGPDDFIAALKQASHVITTTFHGTLLALAHGIPFTTIRETNEVKKFTPILDVLQLRQRLIVGEDEPLPLEDEVDYPACHARLEAQATASRRFLEHALG